MLAAPREKTRYIVQPRGKPLYDDKNSFGLKMLSKMGWTKEKGLGANEDGQKEFITLRYKNNNSGMGFQEKDDQWTENEGKFDSLLKSLNNTGTVEDRTTESLEEKSKGSRARVHYKKFTRGKDTSRYSAKDLANIFGKKSLDEEEEKKEAEKQDSGSDEKDSDGLKHGVETIQSNISSYDYFKQKLVKVFGKKDKVEETEKDVNTEEKLIEEEIASSEDRPKKKKKRKMDHEVEVKEIHPEIEETLESVPKKKKKKKQKGSTDDQQDIVTQEGIPEVTEDVPKKSKKSKKRNKSEDQMEAIEILDNSIKEETIPVDNSSNVLQLNESCVNLTQEKPSKKDKKKKDKKSEDNRETSEEIIELLSDSESKPSDNKKEKKKKRKIEQLLPTISLIEETATGQSEEQSVQEEPSKKKKKKSKNEN